MLRLIPLLFFLSSLWTKAQIGFQKSYGGGTAWGYSVKEVSDGGYILAGEAMNDAYLVKTDSLGILLWTRTFGSSKKEHAFSVIETSDGGYALLGTTNFWDAPPFNFNSDFFLIKTDSNGDTLWTRTYGGSDGDYGYDVIQTSEGGYLLTGWSGSFLGPGGSEIYLVKINSIGNIMWTKAYGEYGTELGARALELSSGDFIIGGTYQPLQGTTDLFLMKINSIGDTLWSKTYGQNANDQLGSVELTSDGGFILGGKCQDPVSYKYDMYLVRADSNGDTLWTKTFGGTDDDEGYSAVETKDGGFAFCGVTRITQVTGSITNAIVIRVNGSGDTTSSLIYGGIYPSGYSTWGYDIQKLSNNNFIVTGNAPGGAYLLKIDTMGYSMCKETNASGLGIIPITRSTIVANVHPAILSGGNAGYIPTKVGNAGSIYDVCLTSNHGIDISPAWSTVFPNPFVNETSIELKDWIANEDLSFVMYNSIGMPVKLIEHCGPKFKIRKEGLASGFYFYNIFSGAENIACGKIIIAD